MSTGGDWRYLSLLIGLQLLLLSQEFHLAATSAQIDALRHAKALAKSVPWAIVFVHFSSSGLNQSAGRHDLLAQ